MGSKRAPEFYNERNNLVPKSLGFVQKFCFASLPHPVSVGGVMLEANIM